MMKAERTTIEHWRGEVTADLRVIKGDMREVKTKVDGLISTVAAAAAAEAAKQVVLALQREEKADAKADATAEHVEDVSGSRWLKTMFVTTILSAITTFCALGVLIIHFITM